MVKGLSRLTESLIAAVVRHPSEIITILIMDDLIYSALQGGRLSIRLCHKLNVTAYEYDCHDWIVSQLFQKVSMTGSNPMERTTSQLVCRPIRIHHCKSIGFV